MLGEGGLGVSVTATPSTGLIDFIYILVCMLEPFCIFNKIKYIYIFLIVTHLNIIFLKINETWGHISYEITTHIYKCEIFDSIENYLKSFLMGRREKENIGIQY